MLLTEIVAVERFSVPHVEPAIADAWMRHPPAAGVGNPKFPLQLILVRRRSDQSHDAVGIAVVKMAIGVSHRRFTPRTTLVLPQGFTGHEFNTSRTAIGR